MPYSKPPTPEKRREYNDRWLAKNPNGHHEAQRKYVAANKEKIRKSRMSRSCFYGNLFQLTMEAQNYCCAICECNLLELPNKQVHADHCHETLRPRGILCVRCNTGLGSFKDDPDRLAKAIEYLNSPTVLPFASPFAEDTIDEDVMVRHDTKRSVQDILLEATRRRGVI